LVSPAILTLTEAQAFQALRGFILGVVSGCQFVGSIAGNVLTVTYVMSGAITTGMLVQDILGLVTPGTRVASLGSGSGGVGTYLLSNNTQTVSAEAMSGAVEVLRGFGNRVPEPLGQDYVVMMQLRQDPLSYDIATYADNVVTGSISGGVMNVDAVTQAESPLSPGMLVLTVTSAPEPVAAGTTLGSQIDGTPGGAGTYNVSPYQVVSSATMYLGQRQDLTPTQLSIQVDVHGPSAGDNVRIISTLIRSEYGTTAFAASGFDVTPLYASAPRFVPFINAEQQYEYRWSVDVELQVNPFVLTPQQFADKLGRPDTIPADIVYPS
jgi:hypothetical protein